MCVSPTNYGKKHYALDTLYIFLRLGALCAILHFQISHERTKITIAKVSESANEISKSFCGECLEYFGEPWAYFERISKRISWQEAARSRSFSLDLT